MSGAAGPAGAAGGHGAWTQVDAGFTWGDLVLPESQEALLQSASATLESGGRLRLLFSGGTGTGKTMACQILAARADVPVLSLDATGKDLIDPPAAEELFRAAGRVGALVVLDHADVLLRGRQTSRSIDGVDAGALLARARAHTGAVVFTATSTRAAKHELLEQFDCAVAFPFPDRRARREIWRRMLPDDSELTAADLAYVADSFQLPGAAIRECCTLAILAAEAQATPVALAHVARALELEYGDRLAGDSTFAALGELRRRAGVEDDGDLPPAPIKPSYTERRRRRRSRPGLRMPPRLRTPSIIGGTRRLRRPMLIAFTALLIAGAGFIAGRVTSSERSRPAAAKRLVAPAAVSLTAPSGVGGSGANQGPPAATARTPYSTSLAAVIFPLHRTRSTLMARLRRTPSWTAAAGDAEQLAAAYTTAAAKLRTLDAGSATEANAALASAFTQTAAALDALRRAELDRSHSERLAALASLVRANRAGAAAYAQLVRLGYRVPVALRSSG